MTVLDCVIVLDAAVLTFLFWRAKGVVLCESVTMTVRFHTVRDNATRNRTVTLTARPRAHANKNLLRIRE